MKRGNSPLLLVGLVLATGAPAGATVLSPVGPTYPIAEQSLLEQIAKRLDVLERDGTLKRIEREAVQRNAEAVRNPPALPGLAPGATVRTHYYDPTFVLDRNIMDGNGRLMYPAGTRKNPLEVVAMTRRLLFFDARDPRQVARAYNLVRQYGETGIKPVLTGGSYLELMKAWKRPVYYDQRAVLVKRLGITQVPALVSQEGMRLRIDELETNP